jgi:CRP-like cAMP-binding protein
MHKKHRVSAEAITASKILQIGRKALISRAATIIAVANGMLNVTNVELLRAQQHSLLLRISANERVGQFLFEMKKRNRRKEVDLVMSRQDIADYLNLIVESVARALTQLESASAISIQTARRIAVHIRRPMAA